MSQSRVRLIDMVRPFSWMMPQVEAPLRRIGFYDKITSTVLAVLVFIVAGQIPIYGIQKTSGIDPLYWMRPMLASPLGTLMEIGVQPLITSSMAMQLLAGLRMIDIDYRSRQDRVLFSQIQKMFALLITFFWAAGSLLAGLHGDINELGYFRCGVIIA